MHRMRGLPSFALPSLPSVAEAEAQLRPTPCYGPVARPWAQCIVWRLPPQYLELEALRLRVWSHGGVRLVLMVVMATVAALAAPVLTLATSAASLLGSRPAARRQP